jgi:hypothetical protein
MKNYSGTKKGKENIFFYGPTGPVTQKRLDEVKEAIKKKTKSRSTTR